jgi:hypothetical protein
VAKKKSQIRSPPCVDFYSCSLIIEDLDCRKRDAPKCFGSSKRRFAVNLWYH